MWIFVVIAFLQLLNSHLMEQSAQVAIHWGVWDFSMKLRSNVCSIKCLKNLTKSYCRPQKIVVEGDDVGVLKKLIPLYVMKQQTSNHYNLFFKIVIFYRFYQWS